MGGAWTVAPDERVCVGCGEPFLGRGAAKWCSERCRKAQYAGTCLDCSSPTDSRETRRCRPCNTKRFVAANRTRWAQHRALVERLWAEGRTTREISAEVGATINISAFRALGYNLPHRRTPAQIARMTAGSDVSMAKARAARRTTKAAA